ncbi:glycosyl hydrolase 2 galactose-binding domain-containing protein [Tichowtungia aerotolerans]|uniref:beta-mannosidase n=1 Tax=Tichowtungia aerotolerans TaxID=2697043 RepID=A0A6P1MDC4_9BACT|nr:hypothetical protein [Tichowtungia aerotolerans]QHI69105.1 hypothetical protein GT409_06475 [Tichowtungia aerotolerans]
MSQQTKLLDRPWSMQAWRPYMWDLKYSAEIGVLLRPECGPYDAVLPGSVQTTLLRHGVIPDWNIEQNSLACEWVEHRHWEFVTEIEEGEIPTGEPVQLLAEGLDYSGWILVDDETVGTFSGALKRHAINLGDTIMDGRKHRLRIIFDIPPEEQGQVGYTSRSKYLKPRYNFGWDWSVRFVPTGIWDSLYLLTGSPSVTLTNTFSRLSRDLQTGTITLRLNNHCSSAIPLRLVLCDRKTNTRIEYEAELGPGSQEQEFHLQNPRLWWPNQQGAPDLYDIEVLYETQDQQISILRSKIGFKHVRWLPCEGAPENARPLLCEVNGQTLFLQGVNWTPVLLDYPDFDMERYDQLIRLYHEMGVNVLRVWGGGHLEREYFYEKCDELGILVWQDFPLSSSGCENYPPVEEDFICRLSEVACDYVRRRSHHVSLLLWCGGNELTTVPDHEKNIRPLDETHPALQALGEVVSAESPGISYLPTSPSGPEFAVSDKTRGKGLHHHVHGPWDYCSTEEEWHNYWNHDDALLRSETGVAGASDATLIRRYAGEMPVAPISLDNSFWRHTSAWWLQPWLANDSNKCDLEDYVEKSQKRQADFLAFALTRCKKRFPRCSGVLIWMGHDCMPVGNNTSIINYDGTPKPAYYAAKEVFQNHCQQEARTC